MRRAERGTAGVATVAALLLAVGVGTQDVRAQANRPEAQTGDATGGAEAGRRARPYAGMGRVMGEVTAVSGGTLTVKLGDGSTMQVVLTDNTRVMKDRGPVRASDLHPGDGLMAMGNLDAPNRTLHAAVVMAEDAAQVKAMRENLGKTYITGRVTAVDLDNARMTVERTDHVAQTIGFDETTSFKRAVRGGGGGSAERPGAGGQGSGGRGPGGGGGGGFGGGMGMGGDGMDRAFSNGESITLADIKVGDFIFGDGGLKKGVFVPIRFMDSPPGQRRGARGGDGAGPAGAPAGGGEGDASKGPSLD